MGLTSLGPLRYGEDLRTFGFAFLTAASIISQWALRDLSTESWAVTAGLLLLTTFQCFQGGVSVHNAAHCPPFKVEWMNRYFFLMLTFWQGAPVTSYIPGHNLSHHKYLQTRKDIMRTSKMKYQSQTLNLLLFFPSILGSIQRNDLNYMKAQKARGRAVYRYFLEEVTLYHAFLVFLLYVDWRKALLIYFLPTLFAKDMLVSLNILQHDGCDPKSKYNHSRNFTSDLLNYLLFNNGYHTIHHMMPGVHWSATKAKHDELVAPYNHPNLNQPSIWGYMIKTHFMGRKRVNYDGSEYTNPGINTEDGDDEMWAYGQSALNASSHNPDEQVEVNESETAFFGASAPLKAKAL